MLHTLQLKSVTCQHPKVFVNTTKGSNNNEMTTGKRLKEAREAAGYTQAELAEAVGKIKQQSIQKIEADIIQNPRKLHLIESVLGLPQGYLQYGEDGKTSGLPRPAVARCPILSWEDAYNWPGNRNDILNENVERLASRLILGINCYALKIKDDSMINYMRGEGFQMGRFVIVDPGRQYKSGDYVIAKKEGYSELLFRKFTNDIGRLILTPLNLTGFDKILINEDIKINGVVVAYLDLLV